MGARPSGEGEIGFVGLGHMGTAMAANLAAAGRQVIAYVRRAEQIGKLEALGLRPTTDIDDVFDCEFVISMLPDDAAVREIVFGRRDRPRRSRQGPDARCDPSVDEHDQPGGCVAAGERACTKRPRLRRRAGVRKSGCRQGPPAVHHRRRRSGRCRALPADLRWLGQRTFVIGTDPARRQPRQVARQHHERDRAGDARRSGGRGPKARAGPPGIHRHHDGHDVRQPRPQNLRRQDCGADYTPGFVLPLALKDVRLALDEAEKAGVPMPSVSVVRDRLITGIARGYAELDWTALGLIAAEEAGLFDPDVSGE